MSFQVRFSRSVVREGRRLQTRIRAGQNQQGQLLYWSLAGRNVNRQDFSDGRLQGSVEVDSRGRATVTHWIRADGRQEGDERVRFDLYSSESRRRRDRIAQGRFVIKDSNRPSEPTPPRPAYRLNLTKPEVAEGDSIRARISAPRRLGDSRLFWKLDGAGITSDDFSNTGLRGKVKLDSRGRGSIHFDIRADNLREGTETARLRLFSDRARTDILRGARFRILDTSKPEPPAPPAIERVRIMPMGDSITVGKGSEDQDGYRQPLRDKLTGIPYSVSFVGKFGTGLRHWGKSSTLISEQRDPITGESYVALRQGSESRQPFRNSLAPDITEAISGTYFSTSPTTKNVLLLTIGTNDFTNQVVSTKYGGVTSGDVGNNAMGEQQDKLAETAFQRLRSLLTRINSAARNNGLAINLLLGTIPTQLQSPSNPTRPASSVTRSEIRQFNSFITQNLNGSKVYSNLEIDVVDQFSAVGSNIYDGVHPTTQGYNAMARAWFNAIEANVLV